MSIHKEHRIRVKARFREEGIDGFDEHQVLEMLLFYAIPQRDTNEIAHRLIRRFGSLPQVIDAPVKELLRVEGVGNGAAVFLSFIRQVMRYCNMKPKMTPTILNDIEACGNVLVPCFDKLDNECVFLLCMDAKKKLLSCRMIEKGAVNSTGISIRKIVDMALSENASMVVLAHNHPSGIALPSEEDKKATREIAQALQYVDVVLLDHLVIADGDYVSMVHSEFYNPSEFY